MATNKPIGIIVPPGEIKSLPISPEYADKTAKYVASNGSSFESNLWDKQNNNPKFIFLKADNPYRPYYDYMVTQFSKQMIQQSKAEADKELRPQFSMQQQKKLIEQANFKQLQSPDDFMFYQQYPKLSALQMDIIKHSAQSVAKNGKNFLMALKQREKNNAQFEFLKQTSQCNKFFTFLTESYMRCIKPQKQIITRLTNLNNNAKNGTNTKAQGRKKLTRSLTISTKRKFRSTGMTSNSLKPQTSIKNRTKLPNTMGITSQSPNTTFPTTVPVMSQLCGSCGKLININEVNQHMRVCMSSNNKKPNIASKVEDSSQLLKVYENMKNERPDIFGESKVQNNKNSKSNHAHWDGQLQGLTKTNANNAMLQRQHQKQMNQYKSLHKK